MLLQCPLHPPILPTHTHPTQHALTSPLTPPWARFGCSASSSPILHIPPASAHTNTKNASLGTRFSCLWLPSPHPQPPNTKNAPTRARFRCSATSSSLPYVEHQERAHKGAFLVFGLFLTPPLTSSTSSTPFGACLTCSTSSPPPLTSNTKNVPLWARSLCSACSSPLPSRRARPLGHVRRV